MKVWCTAVALALAGPEGAPPGDPPPDAVVEQDAESEIDRMIERAVAASEAGDHAETARIMREVHARTGNPADLLAVAIAEQAAGNCSAATVAAARVMASEGGDSRFFEPAQRIARECETAEAPSEPTVTEPPPESTEGESAPGPEATGSEPTRDPGVGRRPARDPLAISLAVVGGIGLGVGTGLAIAAHRSETAADQAVDESAYDRDIRRALARQTGSISAFAVGAAALTGAVVRWVVVTRRARSSTQVAVEPHGAGLSVRF